MTSEHYSKFMGIVRGNNPADAPQISFQVLDNCLPTDRRDAITRRGGSKTWATTGNVLGLGEYSKQSTSYIAPNVAWVLRHRRSGSTSYIEKYDWSADTWSALTLGASTAFAAAGIASFSQHYNFLAICGGRPAMLLDITGNVNRLGGPAPTTAATIATSATGITSAVTTYAYYTFYNSTTGWESSPSPITTIAPFTNKQLDWSALEITCDKEGVDKKRLYRVQLSSGEEPYYRVAEINLATTTYADTIADASLGAQGPDIGDHNPPPTTSYLTVAYADRIWVFKDNQAWYSLPFEGDTANLEYFSEDRVEEFPFKVTGAIYSAAFEKLIIFMPAGKGIHYISGNSESTFQKGVHRADGGTNFPTSVSIHGEYLAFFDTEPRVLTPGGYVEGYAEFIRDLLQEVTDREYNSDAYVWSVWHDQNEAFIWGISATDTTTALWEDVDTGLAVEWEDVVTGATVDWE